MRWTVPGLFGWGRTGRFPGPVRGTTLALREGSPALPACPIRTPSAKDLLWDLETGQSKALEGYSDKVNGALLLEDGKRALSWASDGTLRLWDLETLSEIQHFISDDHLTVCVLSRDGRLAIAGDERGRVMRFLLPGP